MEKVRKLEYGGKEVLVVDYSNLNGVGLIDVFEAAKKLGVLEGKPVLVLSIVNHRTFLTPDFIRHIERELKPLDGLIEKQAIVGLSTIQEWILKGLNLWYKKQVHSFDAMDEALEYLVRVRNK